MGYTFILIGDYDQLHNCVKILHGKTEELYNLHYYTQLKVENLKEEWFGDGATAFFELMENSLLPSLTKVIEAMIATQDRIREVMRTIKNADEETRVFFSTDALTSDLFASRLFLETLSPAAQKAGLVSATSGAGGTSTPVKAGGTNSSTSQGADDNQKKNKAQHGPAHPNAPDKRAHHRAGKIRPQRSGEMAGLSKLGSSLKTNLASSALVGGTGEAPQSSAADAGGAGAGAHGGQAGGAGSAGVPAPAAPDIGLEGGAGLGAGAAGAAAAAAAAKLIKDDEQKE